MTITAADIHRWYCGPWCPKCGWIDERRAPEGIYFRGCDCPDPKPIRWHLHKRWPETKPEGIYWSESGEDDHGRRYKAGWGSHARDGDVSVYIVAALCRDACLGAMADIADVTISNPHELGEPAMVCFYETGEPVHTHAPTIHEAAAIAAHRYMDAKERR